MLTDRYLHGIPKDSRVNTDGRFLHADQFDEKRLNSIRSLNEIAAARGESLAQMALKWVIRDGVVTSVLIGASRPAQILENLKVLNSASFSEEELKKIEDAIAFKNVSNMPARVKCALLAWHTMEDLLEKNGK